MEEKYRIVPLRPLYREGSVPPESEEHDIQHTCWELNQAFHAGWMTLSIAPAGEEWLALQFFTGKGEPPLIPHDPESQEQAR